MMRKHESANNTGHVLFKTLWAWDLWLAGGLGIMFGIAWYVFEQLEATWPVLIPVATASFGIAYLAWNQRGKLRDRLSLSTYGEVLRMADEDEERAMLPYSVVIYLGLASGGWAAAIAIAVGGIESRTLQSILMGLTMFGFAWAFFGLVSLIHHSRVHDRLAARLERTQEQLASEQRLRSADVNHNSQ